MKKCPFCAEEVQEAAIVCKHCGRDLVKLEVSKTSPSNSSLEAFEQFMSGYGNGWILINKSESIISYQKTVPGSNGSCLVAGLLFLLGIIPGVLYLYFSRTNPQTHQIVVTANSGGSPTPSGDSEGMWVYSKFLQSQQPQTTKPQPASWISDLEPWVKVIIVVGIIVVLLFVLLIYLGSR